MHGFVTTSSWPEAFVYEHAATAYESTQTAAGHLVHLGQLLLDINLGDACQTWVNQLTYLTKTSHRTLSRLKIAEKHFHKVSDRTRVTRHMLVPWTTVIVMEARAFTIIWREQHDDVKQQNASEKEKAYKLLALQQPVRDELLCLDGDGGVGHGDQGRRCARRALPAYAAWPLPQRRARGYVHPMGSAHCTK
eukprot:6186107-Pleurochrysis_carterae.AAC.3